MDYPTRHVPNLLQYPVANAMSNDCETHLERLNARQRLPMQSRVCAAGDKDDIWDTLRESVGMLLEVVGFLYEFLSSKGLSKLETPYIRWERDLERHLGFAWKATGGDTGTAIWPHDLNTHRTGLLEWVLGIVWDHTCLTWLAWFGHLRWL